MSAHVFAEGAERGPAWLYADEITHRVVSDYTFMLLAVENAARVVADPIGERALNEVKGRLRAAVTAHRVLSAPKETGLRRLDQDLEELCAALSTSMLADRSIMLTLSSEPVELPAQRCWQTCLIISELITNAAKHAFDEPEGGDVMIDVRLVGENLRCVVSDNGGLARAAVPGAGAKIVDAIARELGGTVWRSHARSGSVIVLVCPAGKTDRVNSAERAGDTLVQ